MSTVSDLCEHVAGIQEKAAQHDTSGAVSLRTNSRGQVEVIHLRLPIPLTRDHGDEAAQVLEEWVAGLHDAANSDEAA